jgi:hypothetical protein
VDTLQTVPEDSVLWIHCRLYLRIASSWSFLVLASESIDCIIDESEPMIDEKIAMPRIDIENEKMYCSLLRAYGLSPSMDRIAQLNATMYLSNKVECIVQILYASSHLIEQGRLLAGDYVDTPILRAELRVELLARNAINWHTVHTHEISGAFVAGVAHDGPESTAHEVD